MRGKAGDPPLSIVQSILSARAVEAGAAVFRVDQVVVARETAVVRASSARAAPGVLVVAYDGSCLEAGAYPTAELLSRGVTVARAGAGFAGPVHLERFAAPGRLCVTDEPRAACLGGIGMLALVVPPSELGHAVGLGTAALPALRSVQVHLTGRLRPFVSASDVALELVRQGMDRVVRAVGARHGGSPVVLEVAGAGARSLSVPERAVIAAIAPRLGAAAAVFASDDRTEAFLRAERRSKAHRPVATEPGAPCDDAVSVDLDGAEPLVEDESGAVRPVRELAGARVSQVVLGGGSGTALRDWFLAAELLKSKHVARATDFFVCVPTRQQLEVLSTSGVLSELVAAGARLVEPDGLVTTGARPAPPRGGSSLRTWHPPDGAPRWVVVSPMTAISAVSTGALADPRGIKRSPRVTLPRELPTGDVLVVRPEETFERHT